MKLFGWMQNKLNGTRSRTSTSSAYSHVKQEPREEFSDWPHALLAIGTFDITCSSVSENKSKNVHEEIEAENKCTDAKSEQEEEAYSSDDLENFTPEDVGKLQKELMKLLSRKRKSDVNRELMNNLPLDRFLNCPSSLELERRISNALYTVLDSSEENKKKRDISRTSVSYLFKKIFVCSDGFSTTTNPSLRDTLQDSRMEKLLKVMMLHKKINAQASSKPTSSTTKRYLQEKKLLSLKSEDEETKERSSSEGYEWVKTDYNFIVLEI